VPGFFEESLWHSKLLMSADVEYIICLLFVVCSEEGKYYHSVIVKWFLGASRPFKI
jgi:hypothetical protein